MAERILPVQQGPVKREDYRFRLKNIEEDRLWTLAYKLLDSSKFRAKNKNLAHELDAEWFYSNLKKGCVVTGLPFEFPIGKGPGPQSASTDRIDPKQGYTKDNSRLVIWWYNNTKGKLNDLEVIEFCKLVLR